MGGPTPIPPRKEWRPGEVAEQELFETSEAGTLEEFPGLSPRDNRLEHPKDEEHLPGTHEKTTRKR